MASQRITVRLTPEALDCVQKAAEMSDMKVAAWAARTLETGAKNQFAAEAFMTGELKYDLEEAHNTRLRLCSCMDDEAACCGQKRDPGDITE